MRTILVVEDRAVDRKFLAALLRSDGYEIVEATDGEEALRRLASDNVDLVISDILMPTVDGYEFVRRMRDMPGLSAMPVIFYTATYHEREARTLARQCGVSDILTKPADSKTILHTVETALGGSADALGTTGDRAAFDRDHVQLLSSKLISNVEASEQRMSAIVDLARQITAEHDPLVLLRRVCDEARHVTLAQHAVLGVLDEDNTTVRTLITSGLPAWITDKMRLPSVKDMPISAIISERRTIRGRGGWSDAAHDAFSPSVASFLAVPIASAAAVYGWITLCNKLGAPDFSEEDAEIATALATHAAVAYENAQLYDHLRLRTIALEQEVAERRRIEEQLQHNEERTTFALEAARMGVWEWDLTADRIVGTDAAFGVGLNGDARTSREFLDLVHPDDRASVQAAADLVIRERHDLIVEFRVIGPEGKIQWVDARARVVNHGDGQPARMIGISTDISDRKLLEAQLRQAQKMEAIGQLAGGVAHDFNNLLTAILGYANLLTDAMDPGDERRADVEEINKAARRAAGLTRQLLAFSRQQVLHPTLVNINTLVADTARMLGRLIGEDIELVTGLAAQLSLVHADATQLEQIIMNLAVNARDAMPGGGRLCIETADVEIDDLYVRRHPIVRPGPYVMLAVSDTGTGIDDETRRRLFEPFFTTKEHGKGTGLGLATVYGIVKQSGGYIWVYSEQRLGSTFKVYLPRAKDQNAAIERHPAAVEPPTGGSETVVVVEDEEAVRFLTRMILERSGYKVFDAGNPAEAEALFDEHGAGIHIMISDVVMPGASGPVLYQRLSGRWPALKVLYMSGYTSETMVRDHGLEAAAAFVQKPFTADSLVRKVREVLDR
jgi:PAS domain S-box-containing protein